MTALGPKMAVARRAAHFRENLGPRLRPMPCCRRPRCRRRLVGLSAALADTVADLEMVITRIRNIAEHAVVPDSGDPFRNTRTTLANVLERRSSRRITSIITWNITDVLRPLLQSAARAPHPRRGPPCSGMEVQPGYARSCGSRPQSRTMRIARAMSRAASAAPGPGKCRRRPAGRRLLGPGPNCRHRDSAPRLDIPASAVSYGPIL